MPYRCTWLCWAVVLACGAAVGGEVYRTVPAVSETPVAGHTNLPEAEIRFWRGAGTLFVNGSPHVRIAIASSSTHTASIADKVDCGMRLVETKDIHIGSELLIEESRGELDFAVTKILDAIPDAYIIVRLAVQPTNAFLEAHPESRVTGRNGETVFQERFNRYFADVPKYRPSWASIKWRKAVDGQLRSLVSYISAQPYAKHIVGIMLGGGHTNEFDQWFGGEGWPGGLGGDWCAESQARFRLWLRDKYENDVETLRKAWGDATVTFADAKIDFSRKGQSPAQRDYRSFHGRQIPETIASWCRSVKLASGRRLTAGAHLAGSRIFSSPYVDFGGGPGTYFNRVIGGHRRLDFEGESVRRHKKWFFEEMDIRTCFYGGGWFNRCDTLDKTLEVLKRTHAQITTEAAGGYWYEFRSVTYAHPAIWRLFRRQAEISELHALGDRSVPTDVCVIDTWAGDLRTNVLSRLGTAYHSLPLETLVEQDPGTLPYKVYIFNSVPVVTTEQRDFLKAHVFARGNWCVFLRPVGRRWPGAKTDDALSNSFALHGISLAPNRDKRARGADTLVLADGQPLPDLTADTNLASSRVDDMNHKPKHKLRASRPTDWTVVQDDEAVPLMNWKTGGVAAALKKHADWTAVYIPTLNINPAVLRAAIKAGGAHQYLDNGDDVIYAGGKLLSFHTRKDGIRRIRLREPADLYDLYEERFIGQGKQIYEVPMQKLTTRLFYLGDPVAALKTIRRDLDAEILARRYAVRRRARKRLEELTAAPEIGPHPPLINGKIRHWLFLGPVLVPDEKDWLAMEPRVLAQDWLEGGAAALEPAPFKQETVKATGEAIGWRPVFTGASRFYAADFYEQPERRLVFYVATFVQSETGGTYNLHLRTERGHQLYLDGKKIGEALYGKRPAVNGKRYKPSIDFPLSLEASKRHRLVMKVFSAGGGNTGWRAKIQHPDGPPAPDVRVFFAEKREEVP